MANNFKVTGIWSAVGVMFLLIAIYLVLEHWSGANSLLSTLFSGGGSLAQTLQGR